MFPTIDDNFNRLELRKCRKIYLHALLVRRHLNSIVNMLINVLLIYEDYEDSSRSPSSRKKDTILGTIMLVV